MVLQRTACFSSAIIRIMVKAICLLLVIGVEGWAHESSRPEFKDFAVDHVYTGAPAAPRLNNNWRTFRTVIRHGAKLPVEFAGHYTVPVWGCGAGCSAFVVVDSVTGTVYHGFTIANLPQEWIEQHEEPVRIEFHPNSRLLKVNGCPGEQNCGFYDYVMTPRNGLKFIRRELTGKEEATRVYIDLFRPCAAQTPCIRTERFQVDPMPKGCCTLTVSNGDGQGHKEARSYEVFLNGKKVILTAHSGNTQVLVTLLQRNTLKVVLAGESHAMMSVQITSDPSLEK